MDEWGYNRASVEVGENKIRLRMAFELGTFTVKVAGKECRRGLSEVCSSPVNTLLSVMKQADTMPEGKYGVGLYGTMYERECLETV